MKIAKVYLWFFNPFLNIVEIRSFKSDSALDIWYEGSGLLGKAYACYSVSDVTELNHKRAGNAMISYVKNNNYQTYRV